MDAWWNTTECLLSSNKGSVNHLWLINTAYRNQQTFGVTTRNPQLPISFGLRSTLLLNSMTWTQNNDLHCHLAFSCYIMDWKLLWFAVNGNDSKVKRDVVFLSLFIILFQMFFSFSAFWNFAHVFTTLSQFEMATEIWGWTSRTTVKDDSHLNCVRDWQ